jgi:predicted PurR-regulated permease PerM
MAFKEFLSSFLMLISWVVFAITLYLFYWTIVMPAVVLVPFVLSLLIGLLCRYFSKKLDSKESEKKVK